MFLVLAAILALVSVPTPSASQEDSTALPLTLPTRVISTNEQDVCPPSEMVRNETVHDVRNMIRNTIIPALCDLGQTQASPAASCSALPAYCPSKYYWVRSSNGTAVQVFCNMDRVCGCNSTGGWARVANLNLRDQSQVCLGEWHLKNYNSEPRRLCGNSNIGASGCLSAMYNAYGISYNHMCGRVIGYAYASVDAFGQHAGPQSIEGPYVDGVSLTHGPPGTRQHIWTFAAGLTETVPPAYPDASCPCADRVLSRADVPSFVGSDYICESGNPGTSWTNILYASDPLWDGQGCRSPPCCELSYPPGVSAPWFCKMLPQTTTDDIEVRICTDQTNEDILVERVELYIR